MPFASLVGPISCTKMQYRAQTIYLIGDLHVRQPTSHCPRQPAIGVSEFIQFAAKLQPHVPIDIFVEISEEDYIANDRSPKRQELFQVNHDFDRCKSGGGARKCQFPNIKYHWIDVRTKSLLPLLSSFEDPAQFRDEIRELRQMWASLVKTYNSRERFTQHLKTRAVEKQLDKISDSPIRQRLRQDMNSCFDLQTFTENIFNDELAAEIDIYLAKPSLPPRALRQKPHFRKLETFLYDDYLAKEACLLDTYVLGRIFKSQAKNVIVYAGDLHIQHIKQVLTKLGFRATFQSQSKIQCVNLSRLPIPLFHE